MAGVKGRSGGARPNTGGARPGAGRKPNPPPNIGEAGKTPLNDPKAFLLALMNDQKADTKARIDAAKALLPFMHPKADGKKAKQAEAAKNAGSGKFAPSEAPKLIKFPHG